MGDSDRRSSLGVYRGYSEEAADGCQRSSAYVEAVPGLRLAVDWLLPTRDGTVLEGPFPVGLIATGYRRAWLKGEKEFGTAAALAALAHLEPGDLVTAYDYNAVARRLIYHGYAIAVVDVIGTGASYGRPGGVRFWEQGQQIGGVVDWIARQPWCNGRVGMFGGSWLGLNCLVAAAAKPEALRCVVPMVPASPYNTLMTNGLLIHGFGDDWSDMREGQDEVELAMPVDGPEGPDLLREALAERGKQRYFRMSDNEYTLDRFEKNVGRQTPALADAESGRLGSVVTEVRRLNEAGVPTLLITGWWDLAFVDDTISLFNALDMPKRLLVGPWNHNSSSVIVETHRWFDRWVKDVDNGVTEEKPIAFGTWSVAEGAIWRQVERWPVPEMQIAQLFLNAGGSLSRESAGATSTRDYGVDYDVTTGLQSRHRHLYRTVEMRFPRLDERAARCAAWVSEPIAEAFEISGSPVLQVRLESSAPAGALIAVLEEIARDGTAHYVTEGVLNLEDRALAVPPHPRPSGIWHPVESELRQPMPEGRAVDVAVEFFAVAWRVDAGSRLRLTIAGADRDNYTVPQQVPPPTLRFHQGGPRPSQLLLPVVDPVATGAPVPDAFADDPILAPFLDPWR